MKAKIAATRGRRRGQSGNALVEFALLSIVMLMLTCGVADFARLLSIANMASGAAEAGAQYGALSPSHWGSWGTDSGLIEAAAVADTGGYAGATATANEFWTCSVGGTQSTTQPTCTTGSLETYIQVTVTIPYTSILKYPMIPDPVNISQTSVIRVQ